MKIIIDAFGGDNAPAEILKGAAQAVKELGVEILAVGNEEKIKKTLSEQQIDGAGMTFFHASGVFLMEDNPLSVRHRDNDTSLAAALRLLKEGQGDAFVSAGSTGALVVGGMFVVGRLKGIKKPGIGSVMSGDNGPFMLIDSGATIDCTPETLKQFALMGSIYMENVLGLNNPRVGLLNIGTEPTKGTPLCTETYALLQNMPDLNFIGNIEARDVPFTAAEVIVTDGFTGNVFLKAYEGAAAAILGNIKSLFLAGTLSKLSYLGVKKGLAAYKKKMDYKEFGGAPIMGLKMPVIKAHGSSDARAFKNAIRQAKEFCEKDVVGQIERQLRAAGVSYDD